MFQPNLNRNSTQGKTQAQFPDDVAAELRDLLPFECFSVQESFATVFRCNPQPLLIVRVRDDRYVEVNKSFLKLCGYRRDEVVWKTSSQLNLLNVVFHNSSTTNQQLRLKTKSGSYKDVLSSTESVLIEGAECLIVALTEPKNGRSIKEPIELVDDTGEDRQAHIVGNSRVIKNIRSQIKHVAPTDATVLIMGETGSGKELIAREIHAASLRKDERLVIVNCATLTSSLIESELFGHEKGAFTGASGRRLGRFEVANKGTIFLDEIGELPLDLQAKLLRVLEESGFERVGGNTTIKTDIRIIVATNRDLKAEVEKGNFREDLWYRLNVFQLISPPLRKRLDDVPVLVNLFVKRVCARLGREVKLIPDDTMSQLCNYSWPGNVRELANVVERAVILSRGDVIELNEQFDFMKGDSQPPAFPTLAEVQKDYIRRVLEDRDWRIDGPDGAARVLGLNPNTLRNRMNSLGIHRPSV